MRITFPRTSYVPAGTASTVHPQAALEVFEYERQGVPYAVGFFGKAQKPSFNYRFRDADRRAAFIREQIESGVAAQARKAQRSAERTAFVHSLKVGDILHTSWGYDQTNVEYFEVIEVRGADVIVRELAQHRTETGYLTGRCSPKPGDYTGPSIRKRVLQGNTLKMSDWGRYAWPGGGERHWSAYA